MIIKTVEELHAAELALSDRLVAARRDLADARVRDAESVLNAALDGDAAAEDTALLSGIAREKEAAISRAIPQVRELRIAAIKAEYVAEAATMRAEAEAKRAESARHAEKTAELLEQLKSHEGCEYVPYDPPMNFNPTIVADWANPRVVIIPLSRHLANEAAGLEERAKQVETKEVPSSGAAHVKTADELVEMVRAWDPRKIAPQIADVVAWCADAEASAAKALAGIQNEPAAGKAEIVYVFFWARGEISEADCAVDVSLWHKGRDGKDSWDSPRRIKVTKSAGVVDLDAYRRPRIVETQLSPALIEFDETA